MPWPCPNHLKFLNLRNNNQSISNHGIALQWGHLKSSELDKEPSHNYTRTKKRKTLHFSDRAFCLN